MEIAGYVGRAVADLIWPPLCAVCGAGLPLADRLDYRAYYCQDCLAAIEFMPESVCPLCGRPYWGAEPHLCGDCLQSPPPYRSARSAVVYGGEAAHSLLKLKYHGGLNQAAALASLCHKDMKCMESPAADMVVPMPLTPERLARRGFNQALELARAVYGPQDPPINAEILERTRDGRRLAALSAKERRQAIKGCFRVTDAARVRGARVLLFDDILTTGSTAGEAARTLLEAGAAAVELRTVARAVPRDWR